VRFVVFGAGAIGGLVGARLWANGHSVVLVARGPHLEAIRAYGLRVDAPDGTTVDRLPATDDVQTLGLTTDDVVLLTTKSQHTAAALDALAGAPTTIPIACVQNGVNNERMALRRFANVYGVCVMCPATHLEAGIVQAHWAPVHGILDIGRSPDGIDDTARSVASALGGAGFLSEPRPDIGRWKYAKLLLNLGNALEAICGPGSRTSPVVTRAREEGVACLQAARIAHASETEDAARRADLGSRPTGAQARGGSSWQSLRRQTGNVEADYLNGEVVLLGRLHGVPTPVNETLQQLANELARARALPGAMREADLARLVAPPAETDARR
jgi:2-dehydropantoate 2-reductase